MDGNVTAAGAVVNFTLQVTRITATGRATKRHWVDAAGNLRTNSAPNIFAGRGETLTLRPTLEGLAKVHASLGPTACLMYGIARDGQQVFMLTTKRRRNKLSKNEISRSRDCIGWGPGIAVFFADRDHGSDGVIDPEELVRMLVEAVPVLARIRWLVLPSASSLIGTTAGEVVRGLRSFHLYALVAGIHVEALAAYLKEALAAAGYVRFEVSAAGSLLERYPIDFAVHQPERVDFAAAPVLGPGLRRLAFEPRYIGGDDDVIDFNSFPPLSAATSERARVNRETARAQREPEARAVSEARIAAEGRRIVQTNPKVSPPEALTKARSMFERGELNADTVLIVVDRGVEVAVTVRNVLATPQRFDRMQTLDPLDANYRDRKIVGILYLDNPKKLTLFSQAHGGRSYTLLPASTMDSVMIAGPATLKVESVIFMSETRGSFNVINRAEWEASAMACRDWGARHGDPEILRDAWIAWSQREYGDREPVRDFNGMWASIRVTP